MALQDKTLFLNGLTRLRIALEARKIENIAPALDSLKSISSGHEMASAVMDVTENILMLDYSGAIATIGRLRDSLETSGQD